jgi:hypothetical protein
LLLTVCCLAHCPLLPQTVCSSLCKLVFITHTVIVVCCLLQSVRTGLREVILDIKDLNSYMADFNTAISRLPNRGRRPLGLGFYLRFSPPTKNLLGPAFNRTSAFIDLATFHSAEMAMTSLLSTRTLRRYGNLRCPASQSQTCC